MLFCVLFVLFYVLFVLWRSVYCLCIICVLYYCHRVATQLQLNISYIFLLLWRCDPTRVMATSFLRFLDHTRRRTTVGRTPLDEWSARHRDLWQPTTLIIIHAPGGIRTHDLSRRGAADLRLRPRGHWDRHHIIYHIIYHIPYHYKLFSRNTERAMNTLVPSPNVQATRR